MTIKLRQARLSDVAALVELENAAFAADRISARSFRRAIAKGACALLVADGENGLSGYCLVLFRAGSTIARLYSIAVKGAGGAGLGGVLLAGAEQAARRRGKTVIRLEVREDNLRASRLYERSGYRRFGMKPGYYADGMAALRYEKPLVALHDEAVHDKAVI